MPVKELAPYLKLNSNNTYVGRQFVQYPRKRWFRAYEITLVFKRKLHPFGKENQYCNFGPLFPRRVRKLWHILVTLVKKNSFCSTHVLENRVWILDFIVWSHHSRSFYISDCDDSIPNASIQSTSTYPIWPEILLPSEWPKRAFFPAFYLFLPLRGVPPQLAPG